MTSVRRILTQPVPVYLSVLTGGTITGRLGWIRLGYGELTEEFGVKVVTGWVRIQRTEVIRTRLISVLMPAKMQRLEVVRGHSEFLSHFSIHVPQANPTQPRAAWFDFLG